MRHDRHWVLHLGQVLEQHLTSDDLRAIKQGLHPSNDEGDAAFTQFLDDGGTVLTDAAQENGHV